MYPSELTLATWLLPRAVAALQTEIRWGHSLLTARLRDAWVKTRRAAANTCTMCLPGYSSLVVGCVAQRLDASKLTKAGTWATVGHPAPANLQSGAYHVHSVCRLHSLSSPFCMRVIKLVRKQE